MSIKVKDVFPYTDLNILIVFENGITKKYNVTQLFEQFDWYKQLENPDIFNLVKVEPGGYGVSWNEDIDISEDELWENSEIFTSPFDGLLSFSDAATKWNIDDSTLRKYVLNGKLIDNIDVKKFGKQWVVREEAMKKRVC